VDVPEKKDPLIGNMGFVTLLLTIAGRVWNRGAITLTILVINTMEEEGLRSVTDGKLILGTS
jgi:hypothetical protein